LKDIQIIDDPEIQEQRKKLVQTYSASDRSSNSPPSTDFEILTTALSSLTSGDTIPTDELQTTLENLESLSHDREYGITIVQPDSLNQLLHILKTYPDPKIRQSCARIIGSSLLNNPESHSLVSGKGLLKHLVKLLEHDDDEYNNVKPSLVFALSAAIASELDILEFMQVSGSQVLRRVYQGGDNELKGKCATFVEDKLLLYRTTSGSGEVDSELSHWCRLFQLSLLSKQYNDKEKEEGDNISSQKLLSSLMYFPRPAYGLM
jgi:hypothetical protein